MAIKWMSKNLCRGGNGNKEDSIVKVSRINAQGIFKLSISMPLNKAAQILKTGYVVVGIDEESDSIYIEESNKRKGIKMVSPKTSKNRVYVRIHYLSNGITDEKALSLTGYYIIKKVEPDLWMLERTEAE